MQTIELTIAHKIQNLISILQNKNPKEIEQHLQELSSTSAVLSQQQEGSNELKLKIAELLPRERIGRYRQIKKKKNQNQKTINAIAQGKNIVKLTHILLGDKLTECQNNHAIFVNLLQAFSDFEQLSLTVFSSINFTTLREQLYTHILAKINAYKQKNDHIKTTFKAILATESLPLKKDELRQIGPKDDSRVQLLGALHLQNCLQTIQRYLYNLLQKQQSFWQDGLFSLYWEFAIKVIEYLFIGGTQLHNVEEPSWMFEYLQLSLNSNYKYLLKFVWTGVSQDILLILPKHFILESYNCFLMPMILKRLEADLPNLNQFLLFNFIDELGQFQQKLLISFNVKANFIQPLLLKYLQTGNVIEKILDYQYSWFQDKIFEDFLNINYSNVNLKNLDAFNIVINFLTLLERLHKKYVGIKHPKLKSKISTFYSKQIMNVVAHIKTSFDRIYNYSKFAKLDIILSFKRVQNQLRNNLASFLSTERELEQKIQKEYYLFLNQYFEACALQLLTPLHKKMHISLGEILQKFSNIDEGDNDRYLTAFNKIYEDWSAKMQGICKFTQYSDGKMKTIFFTYLSATKYSPVGLNLYLKIFEPYLRFLFNEDKHRILISLITMNQQSYSEYLQSHPAALTFLTKEQTNQLQKFKVENFRL